MHQSPGNRKTGAWLNPDNTIIEVNAEEEVESIEDEQEFPYQVDLHTQRWAEERVVGTYRKQQEIIESIHR